MPGKGAMMHAVLNWIFMLFFLFAGLEFLNAAEYREKVVQASENKLVLKFDFDEPEFTADDGKVFAKYDKSGFIVDNQKAFLPYITRFFNLAGDKARYKILKISTKQKTVENYLISKDDASLDITEKVSVEYLGKYREVPVFSLKLFPVSYDSRTSVLEWIESIELELTTGADGKSIGKAGSGSREFLSSLLVNGDRTLFTSPESVTLSKTNDFQINNLLNAQSDLFKIGVKETGIHKVTYDDLLKVNYPVTTIDPRKLKLINKGIEVPVYFKGTEDGKFDPDDYFEFWGEKNEKTFLSQYPDVYADPFSDTNVYWLTLSTSNGLRMIDESGGIVETRQYLRPAYFRETLHFEEDKYFDRFGQPTANLNHPAYEIDHWFFDGGISSVESRSYNFNLPYPLDYGSAVTVKAMFRGKSYYSYPTNLLQGHQVTVWLNEQRVGQVVPADKWEGQTSRLITNAAGALSQSNLKSGENVFRVDMEQSGVTDIVLLNWFEVSYQRLFRADQDFIKFKVQEGLPLDYIVQFEIDGFSNSKIDVYKLGVSKIGNGRIDYFKNEVNRFSYRLTIQDEIFDPKTTYVAVTESGKKKPSYIKAFAPWKENNPALTLTNNSNAADYLIITESLLYQNALKLKLLKEEAGYHPEVVTVENIYDTFNYGIKSPIAIKNFLTYAYQSWSQTYPLKYVVLTGDASYNYKGTGDLVPTMMFETEKYGAAASDYWYALISGDDYIPDIVVARIPANTNQQMLNYLDKINNYQNNPVAGEWRNTSLFISGNDAGTRENITNKPVFRTQNLRLINMKNQGRNFSRRLNTVKNEEIEGVDPAYGSTTDLIEYFDDGVSYVNFLGHGGGGIWADVQLFSLADVDRLNNEHYQPFISSMTCFTGAFENPGKDGLAEKFVMTAKKGAIGMVASSGVGWTYNDFAIEWGLFDYLWQDNLTFGEAVDMMKIYYLANPIYYTEDGSFYTWSYNSLRYSMVSQYNFLGDPALKIQKPSKTLSVSVDKMTPAAGDSISISVNGQISGGELILEMTDIDNYEVLNLTTTYNQAGVVVKAKIPEDRQGESLFIKAYVSNNTEDASGSRQIGVSKSIISDITVSPENPLVNQPLSFRIVVESPTPVTAMNLLNFRDFESLETYGVTIPMEKVADTLFQSTTDFPGFSREGQKYFDIWIQDQSGAETTFRWNILYVGDPRPDLTIDPETIRYSGNDQLQLEFKAINDSRDPVSDVVFMCFDDDGLATGVPFFEQTVSFGAGEKKTVYADYNPSNFQDQRTFKIAVDPVNSFEERDEQNNVYIQSVATDHFYVDYQMGTTKNGVQNDTLLLANIWGFHIPANSITASSVINFKKTNIREILGNGEQRDLKYIRLMGQSDTSAMQITIKNSNTVFTNPAVLSAKIDTSKYSASVRNNLSFFRYDTYLGLWVKITSTLKGDELSTAVNTTGMYGVFNFTDEKSPVIELTANGRPLVNDMLVTNNPAIAILLQDENGLNFRETFFVKLNGEDVPQEDMTYPDSIRNANTISILTSPKLTSGAQELEVTVADVNGNVSTTMSTFQVTEGFNIKVFGNYPNPFEDETIISFFVDSNDEIDGFSIKIYTTSGRLIRSRMLDLDESVASDNIKMPSYHELIWDGTDDGGNQVANGVYFAVVKGKYKGKTVKHTLKIARLQ